jgi:hypothetical protein
MFLKIILTKQYENNSKKYFRLFQGGLRGFMGVSKGFKCVIYEFRSCKGICMFLKSILTKQYENNNEKYLRWFQGGFKGV